MTENPEDQFSDAREEGRRKLAEGLKAGIYCRMSLARDNDTTKVDDQEQICRRLAGQLGWEVSTSTGEPDPNGVYQDNNQSAWQEKRKRKGWDTMIADVEAGRINAIVVYHGDRLLRTQEDLLVLIKLARTRGIRLASPAGTRDIGNYDDQFILEIEASMAKRESANTSRRRKAQYERWRREGKVRPGGRGGRAFGFATDGTLLPADRCDLATRLEVTEADMVREMARRLLAGEHTGAIARDVSARGWRTPAGGDFTHSTIRKMLGRPRYAGLMPDGEATAAWPAVLERETWESACSVLDARAAGFAYTTNARRYLLSGIAACSECGSGLQVRPERKAELTGYGCVRKGCRKVQRNARLLDEYVIAAAVARLALEGNPAASVPAAPGVAAEFAALAGQHAELEALVKDHTQSHVKLLLARLDSVNARLAQLRELAGGSAGARLRQQYAGITEKEFRDLPLGVQRSLVTACVAVMVRPASRRGPGFSPADVMLTPR